ncbi:hypothetical protein AB0C34_17400 [Nocardia sp. NPDC049220]|uniref:hypothetical protein n=1 Tax=Nocardia sp. NPDC049220 TaxID=3155273 RepID=UPI00340A93B8
MREPLPDNTSHHPHVTLDAASEANGMLSGCVTTAAVTAPEIAARYGIPEANQRHFQQFADERNIVIDVRPANPTSVAWLERGALPKPESIKAKSITELDTMLGMSAQHLGLVGYFEPVLPDTVPPHIDATALQKRYDMRRHEFHALRPTMARYTAAAEFALRDGVVHSRDSHGNLRPVTSDHDLFDIRHTDGRILQDHEYQPIIQDMQQREMGVQHGPHMYWQPCSELERHIFHTIIETHRSGREPLIRFEPNTAPTLTTPDNTGPRLDRHQPVRAHHPSHQRPRPGAGETRAEKRYPRPQGNRSPATGDRRQPVIEVLRGLARLLRLQPPSTTSTRTPTTTTQPQKES